MELLDFLLSHTAGSYARVLMIAGGLIIGFTVVSAFPATRVYLSEQFPAALRGPRRRALPSGFLGTFRRCPATFGRHRRPPGFLSGVDHAVGRDKWRRGDDKLSRVGDPFWAPEVGMASQDPDPSADASDHPLRCARILAGDVISDCFEVADGRCRPDDPHFGIEYLPATRASSSSVANSCRSAAAIPASIF